jgi:hypothetical protein
VVVPVLDNAGLFDPVTVPPVTFFDPKEESALPDDNNRY